MVFGYGIYFPYTAHYLQGIPVDLSGQVFADYLPAIAIIIGSKDLIGCKIKPSGLMLAYNQGSIPVPSVVVLPLTGFGLNAQYFST